MPNARILGTGSYLPQKCLSNEDLTKIVDTSDEWIVTRTGIHTRHIIADNEQTSDMAVRAAQQALKSANISVDEIDLIIVATTTADMIFPSTACIVQEKLGIKNNCAAFDVQAVCAGFMYAVVTASAYIQSNMAKKALVIGADAMSRLLNWQDRSTCVLFGDGAGAVVIGATDEINTGFINADLRSDGSYASILQTPGAIHNGQVVGSPFLTMDGPAVFKFAVTRLVDVGKAVLKKAGLEAQDIDCVVPHQANKRIIDSTAKHLGIPLDKIVVTVGEHGNTSAASIPLALDAGIRSGQIQKNNIILLEGIGGGFAWGAVLLRY